jgi:hypothetical protein
MNTKTDVQLEFDFMKPDQLTFNWDSNIYFSTNNSTSLLTLKPNYNISFYGNGGKVGELDWNDGKMKFIGDAEESAQLFFDNIIKRYFQIQFDLKS